MRPLCLPAVLPNSITGQDQDSRVNTPALECDVPSLIHLTAQRSTLQEYAKLAMTKGHCLISQVDPTRSGWMPGLRLPRARLVSSCPSSMRARLTRRENHGRCCRKASALQEGSTVGGGQLHTHTQALSSNTQSFSSLVWCACKNAGLQARKASLGGLPR